MYDSDRFIQRLKIMLLAIDAATDVCSVALALSPDVIRESLHPVPREHTQQLLPMVAELLNAQSLSLSQLGAIAFSCGPGSFTGLRITLSVAQGLAYGADLPLVPVSTLEAMALGVQRLKQLVPGSRIFPVIDARMNEVYWSAYETETDGVKPLLPEQVGSPAECADMLAGLAANDHWAVGSGWHYQELQSLPVANPDLTFYPSAFDIARRGLQLVEAGQTVTPQQAQPVYLRNDIHWQKRQRIRV